MCTIFKISWSGFYSYKGDSDDKDEYTDTIIENFIHNYQKYGTRRIQASSRTKGIHLSRSRIARVMASESLVSCCTVQKFRLQKDRVNDKSIANEVDQNFDNSEKYKVIVSDLTYVKVGTRWCYVCSIVDLSNRESIASSCGPRKNEQLEKKHLHKSNQP